jgi:hypothetical protein
MEIQPYKEGTWAYNMNLKDWLDGWKEAEETFYAEEKQKEEDDACPTCGSRGHGSY